MMLGASCDGATSEVSKPEKDVEPDAEVCSEIPGGQGRSKPRSGSGSEAEASPLDFIVATEREFEEVLAILGVCVGGGGYLRESVHGIDAGETAPPERGERVAWLLEHFLARLSRDVQLGPRKLKKFRLITKQNKGARRARPLLKGPPGFGILLVQFNSSALLGVFSQLPREAGGDLARLLLSPSLQRDGKNHPRSGRPTGRIRVTCASWRPRAWNGAWTAARARTVLTLCTRPPASRTAATACGATSASTPSAATVRRGSASFCRICSARAHFSLNVVYQLFPAPQLWSQVADFHQAGWGLALVKGYN
ncbi:hypothetical protein FD754_016879 [Muntiacus muntjak]|uniref:Uncharacterized protein n=1 Tax=Muntiacus muntjak TaxID=9888 RepID=A0A5N3VS88_MUNMU|nr:hypothetical protein FD754_016879 [Muntiacus muntjak]